MMAMDTMVTPSFYRRITAWFVDVLLLWGIVLLVLRIALGVWFFRPPPLMLGMLMVNRYGNLALYWIAISYYGLFHGLAGWTPGKAIVSLRVVDADGQRASVGQILLRSLLYPGLWFIPIIAGPYVFPYMYTWINGVILIILFVFPLLDYVMTPFDFNGQRSLHDLFSHTRVVVE